MQVHNIVNHSVVDGEGVRLTIFFQGCPHKCKNCQNFDTWNPAEGKEYTPKELFNHIDKIIKKDIFIDGISISGGEPFYQYELSKFLQMFKIYYPDKSVWCWTGYLLNKIPYPKALEYIDVIIDGKFKEKLKDTKKDWRGSDNQKMYKKVKNEWKLIN